MVRPVIVMSIVLMKPAIYFLFNVKNVITNIKDVVQVIASI